MITGKPTLPRLALGAAGSALIGFMKMRSSTVTIKGAAASTITMIATPTNTGESIGGRITVPSLGQGEQNRFFKFGKTIKTATDSN